MKILIKQSKIINTLSPFNGQIKDILLINGVISSIADEITENADQIIQVKNLCISIGWLDLFSKFGDPGYEYLETNETGSAAAAAGGFTEVFILPNTNPVIDNKSQIENITTHTKNNAVNLLPIGAVSKNTEGVLLAEMYDMKQSGAIAFSDGINPIQSSELMLKALQYVKNFDGIIIQVPNNKTILSNGLINEGIVSTQLGLPGSPIVAEEILINRDIKLLEYTNSKLHITGISAANSVNIIKFAKQQGLKISCSVTPHHLYFTDENLRDYDTNLKINPPLRTNNDRTILLQAIIDETIDCIASHHFPQCWDSKTCEFEYAKEGMIGLESLFGVIWYLLHDKISIDKLINILTINPRKIFGLAIPEIKENEIANFTLFTCEEEYIFDISMIKSKSKNSGFLGKKLKGRVIGIINKNKIILN